MRKCSKVLPEKPAVSTPLEFVCAWCHPGVNRPNVTHGMCASCARAFKAQASSRPRRTSLFTGMWGLASFFSQR